MTRIDSKTNALALEPNASRKKANQANRDMFRFAYEAQLKQNARDKVPQKVKEPKKILIAEYDLDPASFTKMILEREGYDCTLAQDGDQLVTLASSLMPDLIITGTWLTKIDGIRAAELIRDDPKTCSIPILLASRKSSLDWLVQDLPRQFDYYIQKPFTSTRLISGVELLIR